MGSVRDARRGLSEGAGPDDRDEADLRRYRHVERVAKRRDLIVFEANFVSVLKGDGKRQLKALSRRLLIKCSRARRGPLPWNLHLLAAELELKHPLQIVVSLVVLEKLHAGA